VEHGGGRTSLLLLVIVGAALGAALWVSVGPPTAVWSLPDGERLREVLTASSIAHGDAITVAAAIAWFTLMYLAATMALRAAAVGADRATHGARWARTALRLTNLITIPAVRRVVDGSVAGTLLVASWMPATARVALAEPPVPAIVALAPSAAASGDHETWPPRQQEERQAARWTARSGDTPWSIARSMYGDGTRQVDVIEANRGRLMADGTPLVEPRQIPVGSEVLVPLPSQRLGVEHGLPVVSVVRGDTLWDLAGTFLGDPFRWPEIREANRDRDMGGGLRFTNPHLIYPGWELILPDDAVVSLAPLSGVPTEPEPVDATPSQATPAADGFDTALDPAHDAESAGSAGRASEPGEGWSWPSPPRPLVLTAAGFAVLGATALFVHRAHVAGRLALPSFKRPRAALVGDAARVTLAARALSHAIASTGRRDASLRLAHELTDELVCTVACPEGGAETLAASADRLSEVMGCAVAADVLDERHVELVLKGIGETALRAGESQAAVQALMLPVGTDAAGRITYLNLAGAGSVLLSGIEAERRDALHAWIATLATTAGADELTIRTDAPTALLIGDDLALPHFAATDAPETALLVDELEDVMQSRDGAPSSRALVALLDVSEGTRCDTVVLYGPPAGVYVIGVEGQREAAVRETGLFGAVIDFGAADTSEADEANMEGSIVLTAGDLPPVRLDPVLVRRDTSPRWRTDVAAPARPPTSPADGDRIDGASLSTDERAASYDWRRAIWEPDTDDPLEASAAAGAEEPRYAEESDDTGTALPPASILPPSATPTPADPTPGDMPPEDGDSPADSVDEPAPSGPSPSVEPEAVEGDPANLPAAALTVVEGSSDPRIERQARSRAKSRGPEPPQALRQQSLFTAEAAEPGDAGGAIVEVRCLGNLEVRVAGKPVTAWRYEKAQELVALLVAYGGAPVMRRTVVEALWPGVDWDSSARHLMNNAATTFRRTVRAESGIADLEVLSFASDRYQIQPGILWSDVDEFEATLRLASTLPPADSLPHYERAIALYRGDFLASDDFHWVIAYRREFRKRFISAVAEAGERAIAAGEPDRAVRILRAGLEQAPAEETIARALMRALGAAGDPSGAVKVYQVHTEAIREELGMATALPSAEMRQLFEALAAGAAAG